MPFPRAPATSTSILLLRHGLRPGSRTTAAAAPLRASTQVRTQMHGSSSSGGKEDPLKNPSTADVLRRNWVPIGGAALAVLAAYAYFWRNPEEVKKAGEKSLGEMSGRTKSEKGGFRND